ncbi:MAG: hypothetical protein ACRDI2_25475, partial [Chloroflexota bacterium]
FTRPASDSSFRWTVGWPEDGWVLRHQLQLADPAAGPVIVALLLAHGYDGPARVLAAVNGHDLGPLRLVEPDLLQIEVPAHVIAGQSRLVFDLRLQPQDPTLRLVAQRWVGGATLGGAASSFYDTQRWWPGTFNDVAGRRQTGVYIIRVRGIG